MGSDERQRSEDGAPPRRGTTTGLGRYAGVGFELVVTVAIGYLAGRFGDRRLGTTYLTWVGAAIGAIIGFRDMFRVARLEAAALEKEDREHGPPPGIEEPDPAERDPERDEADPR